MKTATVTALRVRWEIEEHRHIGYDYWHPTSRIHKDMRHALLQRMPAVPIKPPVRVLATETIFIPVLNWNRIQKGVIKELSEINLDLGQQETSIYRDALTIYPDGGISFWSGDIYGDIHPQNDNPVSDFIFWL